MEVNVWAKHSLQLLLLISDYKQEYLRSLSGTWSSLTIWELNQCHFLHIKWILLFVFKKKKQNWNSYGRLTARWYTPSILQTESCNTMSKIPAWRLTYSCRSADTTRTVRQAVKSTLLKKPSLLHKTQALCKGLCFHLHNLHRMT